MERIWDVLKVIGCAILPYIELRGAIPIARGLGFNAVDAYIFSVIGNMIPVIPIILFIDPVSRLLSKIPIFKRFFDWVFARAERNRPQIEKYGYWGLAIFVAIPLPMTGAWSGSLIAFLMGLKKRDAFISILLGVLGAGIIVTLLTSGFINLRRLMPF
ncbi:MAG TPA: small multi-drug export protein [Bacillota bacterium]|jgi:uncharacterized membrane protein|nr:small multi-drug export protein [Bacillota bacterium]HOL08721.1 small multi-drug export protein [Bacillota bacterium]HPO96376.1 small multi-drug export protein [Bacillota bacterium]